MTFSILCILPKTSLELTLSETPPLMPGWLSSFMSAVVSETTLNQVIIMVFCEVLQCQLIKSTV